MIEITNKLFEIEYHGSKIHEWNFMEIDSWRLYYKLTGKESFDFYAVEWHSNISGEDTFGKSTTVECIFNGVAYFDGVRHLYFGDEVTDNYGYLYCPNLGAIAELLRELNNLVKRYCPQAV